jgi:hypothetical protein
MQDSMYCELSELSQQFDLLASVGQDMDQLIRLYNVLSTYGLDDTLFDYLDRTKTTDALGIMSVESFNENNIVALESIESTIKKYWDKFIVFIKKLFTNIRKLFFKVIAQFQTQTTNLMKDKDIINKMQIDKSLWSSKKFILVSKRLLELRKRQIQVILDSISTNRATIFHDLEANIDISDSVLLTLKIIKENPTLKEEPLSLKEAGYTQDDFVDFVDSISNYDSELMKTNDAIKIFLDLANKSVHPSNTVKAKDVGLSMEKYRDIGHLLVHVTGAMRYLLLKLANVGKSFKQIEVK